MSSLCDTCARRTREIEYCGFSTVRWTGRYTCGPYPNSPTVPETVTECARYTPRSRGQTTLEAFA